MSLAEVKADHIRYEVAQDRVLYHPRCFFCLKEVTTISYIPRNHYVCQECRPQKKLFKKYYADHESKTLMEAIHKEREREKAEQFENRCPDKNEISRP